MSETAKARIPEDVLRACEIAGAEAPGVGQEIVVIGCGRLKYGRVGEGGAARWHRYVWRDGRWQKVARNMRQGVGPVRTGEVLVDVVDGQSISGGCLVASQGCVQLVAREGEQGLLYVFMPDGQVLIRPNPRAGKAG